MTLSRQLIDLIRRKEISVTDRQRSALFVLDGLANALAGRNTEAGRKLLQRSTFVRYWQEFAHLFI